MFTKSFIAVGLCGLCGCRVTGGVHGAAAERRGQENGKRGDAANGEGGGKPKTKQEIQTKWRGREDMKNVQEPYGVFVCCGCVVVEGL